MAKALRKPKIKKASPKKTRISHVKIVNAIPEELKDPGIIGITVGPRGERYTDPKKEQSIFKNNTIM